MFIDRWETNGTQTLKKWNGFIDYPNRPDRIISQMIDKTNGRWALDSTTMGYWYMDENTGTNIYDSSSKNHTGSINGASWTQGRFGRSCLYFDGINDRVEWSNTSDHTPPHIRIECWIKPESRIYSVAGVHAIVNNYHVAGGQFGYQLSFRNNGKLMLAVGLTAAGVKVVEEPTVSTVAGNWYHVAGIVGATKTEIFINGVSRGSTTYAADTIKYVSPPGLKLGRCENLSEWFHGNIDEVRILNEAKTDFN